MQTVSQAWKLNQQQHLTSEGFVEVSLLVGDPAAQGAAQTTDNGSIYLSNTAQISDTTEKTPVKYGMLERDIWALDGSVVIVPDAPPYGDTGYIGNLIADSGGEWTTNPMLTLTFSQVFEPLIPGITITWGQAYDEYADTFRVTAYNGTAVAAQKTVSGNTDVSSVVEMDIAGYDKITIEILKWGRGNRRARITSIVVGIKKTYGGSQLLSYSHDMTVDPLSASLPLAQVSFEVLNLNGEYNPDNPEGAEKYLMERQSIVVRYGYKLGETIEWIAAGTFYMNEWETPQNGISATFSARDLLEYMSDNYTGPSTGTLMEIAEAALSQAALPTGPEGENLWLLDSSLASITAPSGVVLSEYTIAEVLQLVANAACCVFYQDRAGFLHIEPLGTGTTDYRIDQFNGYANAEISLTKQLKAVNVNDGAAVVTVGTVGETQKIDNPLISAARAQAVAQWAADYLQNRKVLSGDFRADPRLDALDRVTTENQFSESTVLITDVSYTFSGAFRGSYEGRSGV